jgi:Cu(I)/Ag(I) efflux system membrane fusion protein
MAEQHGKTKRILRGVGAVGVILLAVGVGYLLRSWRAPSPSGDGHEGHAHAAAGQEAEAEAPAKSQLWTCSMHPQIKLPKPGKCPICFMDLIPLESGGDDGGGLRELTISESSAELMEIEAVPVERRFVTARVRMVGKIDYDETRVSYITAWVPGRLDRLFVDYTGVPVKKGDHMVTLYSPELLSAQEELLQALKAVAQLRNSDVNIVRETAAATVEAAREKLRLWGLTPDQIAAVEERGKAEEQVTIYAPGGGIVVHKNAQEGMYVNTGTRIYTIADLSHVWVNLDAYESDLAWLRYGQPVQFTTESYPGEVFTGTISFIHPVLNEATRTVKVRVNVPNEDGRLKPGMFVRAVAEASVATGGRVMDASLAGKWISPMHPEVVKDNPGECDVCGMPLVRAESLGYVGQVPTDEDRPLVIPASAPMITGKRAIVYVRLSGTDKPTFEGREIVLGPRAGDYYVVRHGLAEGERVVTEGNFKLDAELQIQAKPSMMTPGGGGGGGEHAHHGSSAATGPEGGTAGETGPELPALIKSKLHDVLTASQAAATAADSHEAEQIRDTYTSLGDVLSGINASALSGHAAMLWKEYGMLLGNDVAEALLVRTPADADALAASTRRHAAALQAKLGLSHAAHSTRSPHELNPDFKNQLGAVIDGYLAIQVALAKDDAPTAKTSAQGTLAALAEVDMELVQGQDHMDWMKHATQIEKLLRALAGEKGIEPVRAQFALLSEEVTAILTRFGSPAKPLYRASCPMAFDNRGASWVQSSEEVSNPYFGAMMLRCGEIEEVLR